MVLGVSERTFRRWRERFEAEGAAGLYHRHLAIIHGPRLLAEYRPDGTCKDKAERRAE